ncbi:MAG: hypothetical protein IT169_01540 [Bryobacterales bacterium]|nr:hypothetical protein [Bryobacterales bacterium]
MNARIDESSVRIRLLVGDVAKLASDGAVECSLAFVPGAPVFGFRIETAPISEPHAVFTDGQLLVTMPQEFAAAWPLNDDVGLDMRCGQLRVTVEKDLRRLKPWRTESVETERYPNPRSRNQAKPV